MPDPMTEAQAIATLQRLARRWPSSLRLFSWSGSLVCIDNERSHDGGVVVVGDSIPIPNEGGDPDHLGERDPDSADVQWLAQPRAELRSRGRT